MFPRAQAQQVQVPETLKLVRPRKGESRGHKRNSASTITENNDSTVSEATSGVGISEPFEKESCSQILTDLKNYLPVVYTSTNQSAASDIPWPMWTVSHMMTFSSLAKVISHYRALKLADHLNDKDLRSFLDEQLCKEKAGLSEITISMCLRTRVTLKIQRFAAFAWWNSRMRIQLQVCIIVLTSIMQIASRNGFESATSAPCAEH